MSKCRYDLSEDCNNTDCLNCVLDKIIDEVCAIDDEIVLNPDSFYEYKAYVRFSDVIDIINKHKTESEGEE